MRGIKMLIKIFFSLLILNMLVSWANARDSFKISGIKGDVRVRIGMEEEWRKAQLGMILEELDTILSGENSSVVLTDNKGLKFTLGSYAILDIADLRKIQERELFLYLMSVKVDKIPVQQEKAKIRVGNVSVVHGNSKQTTVGDFGSTEITDWYNYEINGATALFDHQYYPNAIIKFHKIRNKYEPARDQGKIEFLIGQSFEALGDSGQAVDSYHSALNEYARTKKNDSASPSWLDEAMQALQKLNSE
jgi:hypothetical protein